MTGTQPPTGVAVGLYGKHPAFGDFVTAGLSERAQATLESWLHQVMPAVRDGWGEAWEPLFDASPVIRFWFGSALTGEPGALCGIMAPSRDKVGRRFPLIAGMSGGDQPAPVQGADQTFYAMVTEAVAGFVRPGQAGAKDFAAYLQDAVRAVTPGPADPIEPAFWAARGDGDLERLWADVSDVDHARAAAARSYLWCEGPGGAAVHVTRGLPGPEVLAWLMTEAVRGQPQVAAEPEPLPELDIHAPPAVPMPTLDDADPDRATQMPDLNTNDRTMPPMADHEITVAPVARPQLTD